MKAAIVILLIFLVLLSSCRMAQESLAGSASAEVSDIDGAISEIDALEEELDFSELDALEEELAEIDW